MYARFDGGPKKLSEITAYLMVISVFDAGLASDCYVAQIHASNMSNTFVRNGFAEEKKKI